jgi:hypothetical protein
VRDKRGTVRIGERPMGHPALGVIWSRAGDRWCGVFQVVKAAQSRERTERTLLTALSQLLWPDKGRAVWFSLGENHEKACRFGLHQLRNCLRGDSCSPQGPSRSAGILRKDLICHFRCHITVGDHRVIILTSADAFPVVGGRCTGRARRCKAKQAFVARRR